MLTGWLRASASRPGGWLIYIISAKGKPARFCGFRGVTGPIDGAMEPDQKSGARSSRRSGKGEKSCHFAFSLGGHKEKVATLSTSTRVGILRSRDGCPGINTGTAGRGPGLISTRVGNLRCRSRLRPKQYPGRAGPEPQIRAKSRLCGPPCRASS